MGFGWVDAATVEARNVEEVPIIDAPSEPETVSPLPVPEGAPSATAIEFVNVRTGPGTGFPVLGVAQPGSTAEVDRSQPGCPVVAGAHPHNRYSQRIGMGFRILGDHSKHK